MRGWVGSGCTHVMHGRGGRLLMTCNVHTYPLASLCSMPGRSTYHVGFSPDQAGIARTKLCEAKREVLGRVARRAKLATVAASY